MDNEIPVKDALGSVVFKAADEQAQSEVCRQAEHAHLYTPRTARPHRNNTTQRSTTFHSPTADTTKHNITTTMHDHQTTFARTQLQYSVGERTSGEPGVGVERSNASFAKTETRNHPGHQASIQWGNVRHSACV